MAVAENIEVVLELTDRGFQVKMRGAADEMRRFASGLQNVDRRLQRTEHHMRGFTATARDWTLIIGQARNAMHQLWAVFGALPARIVKINAEIERMTKLLEGMSDAGTAMGRAVDASNTLGDLFEQAKNAPFTINALTDTFVKFKSVGLDPTDGSMRSLVDAVAAFGGTDETLHRAAIAIQQMGGKGVISMEELRQQLGEAVPQAISLMAQSMGVSYGKLVDEISKGRVAAEPALKSMFNAFDLAFGGRAQNMMDTYNGKLARMNTTWKQTVNQSSGLRQFQEGMKDVLDEMTRVMGTGAFNQLIDGFGSGLAWAAEQALELSKQIGWAYNRAFGLWEVMKNAWEQDRGANFFANTRADIEWIVGKVEWLDAWMDARGGDSDQTALADVSNIMAEKVQGLWGGGPLWDKLTGRSFDEWMWGEEGLDLDAATLRETMRLGREITADELEQGRALYDQHLDEMEQARQQLEDQQRKLAQALTLTSAQSDMTLSQDQVGVAEGRIEEIRAQRAEIEVEVQKLQVQIDRYRQTITDLTASGAPSANDQDAITAGEGRIAELTGQVTQIMNLSERLRQEENTLVRAVTRTEIRGIANDPVVQALEAEKQSLLAQIDSVKTGMGQAFDPSVVEPMRARLEEINGKLREMAGLDVGAQLERATDEALAMADAVKATEARLAELEEQNGDMLDSLATGYKDAAEGLADPYLDKLDDLQTQSSAMLQDMMSEINDVMMDTSLSAEAQMTRRSEIIQEYYNKISEGFVDVGEAAQAELAKQGTAGIQALALVWNAIRGMLATLGKKTDDYSPTGEIPTISDDKKKKKTGKSPIEKARDKFKDIADDLKRDARDLGEKLANPFGFQIPDAVQKTREKLEKVVEELGKGKAEAAGFTAQMEKMMQLARQNALSEATLDMTERNRELTRGLMGDRGQNKAEAQDTIDFLMQQREYYRQFGEWRAEHEKLTMEQIRLIQDDFFASTPLGEFAGEWKDFADSVEGMVVDAFKGIGDELANLIVDGEAGFADLAKSILKSLLSVTTSTAFSMMIDMLRQMAMGMIGGGGPVAQSAWVPGVKHAGGIVGGGGVSRRVDPMAFAGAPRFHTGGIVGHEVPIIAQKGEGVFTKEQMKALGKGRSQAPETTVNIINETGASVGQAETSTRFDGEKMVLDVVLSAAGRPGGFRDSMKEMLR